MELLKKLFRKSRTQSVGAIQYPDRILIETEDQVKHSFWIRTDQITFLPVNVSDKEIGETLLKHLELSKTNIPNPDEESFEEIQDNYERATGLKTLEAQMKDAKYVSVNRTNGKITFSPTINGGAAGESRGYAFKPKDDFEINDQIGPMEIGKMLKNAWAKCE